MSIFAIDMFVAEPSDPDASNDMRRTNYIKIYSHIHANTRTFI